MFVHYYYLLTYLLTYRTLQWQLQRYCSHAHLLPLYCKTIVSWSGLYRTQRKSDHFEGPTDYRRTDRPSCRAL